MEPPRLSRNIWRRTLDDNALEFFTLQREPDGAVLSGVIVAIERGEPVLVEYEVQCDAALHEARFARVRRTWREQGSELSLVREGDGWSLNGAIEPALAGCGDIDIEWTPATNIMPIARLAREDGACLDTRAAWVRLPALSVELSRQRYTRLAAECCRYENLDNGFSAEIEVDGAGIPVQYGAIWSRVAAWSLS